MKKIFVVNTILVWSLFFGGLEIGVARAEPAPPSLTTLQETLDEGLTQQQIMNFLHHYLSFLLTQAQLREQTLTVTTQTPRYLKFIKKVLDNYHSASQPFYNQGNKPFIDESLYALLLVQLDQLLLSI